MTIYIKELFAQLDERYGKIPVSAMAEKLFEIGVVDHTLCKVLAVRQFVAERLKAGEKKIDAMWNASEHFCCTYEYIRKCIYYYTDVNME